MVDVRKGGIRPNPTGDRPRIHATAFVDPSAQIIGNVVIGPKVYVGPLSVIRADEADAEGKVHPVLIEEETIIQDGVIIHGRAGTRVKIGPRTNVAHGVTVHGPAEIGEHCFLAIRAVVIDAVIEDSVWVGVGSIILGSKILAHTWVPTGSIIRSEGETRTFRLMDLKEEAFKQSVYDASAVLRDSYHKLYGE